MLQANKVIPASYISGELDNEKQRKILEDFRNGKIAMLCGSDILITGVDVPNLKTSYLSALFSRVVIPGK